MKCSLGISNFLERSLVLHILLFCSISLHWSLRKAFLSFLAILWNSAFKWVYLSFSCLPLTSLLLNSAIFKASSDNHGEGNGSPLQYSCLENPMDGGAWWAEVCGVSKSWTRLSDFTFTFHFHALEKEMASHSSILAWRIPGTVEPGRLPSMGSHRVGHDWNNLAAAVAAAYLASDSIILVHCWTIFE